MRVLVTGATGFIGRHVVPSLLDQGLEVIATSRNKNKAKNYDWYNEVEYIECDYHNDALDYYNALGKPDVIIHLAWNGLPNYKDPFHVERNLPANCLFLKNFIEGGIKKMVVTGTCYEYGIRCGCLHESDNTQPVTQYGLAKDTLRKYLEFLVSDTPTSFNWVRLFYLYGDGQNQNSLLPQLERAISEGEKVFNMSGGEQLRDYLSVEDAARNLCTISLQSEVDGIVNCCSGNPISIRRLVENKINLLNSDIELNLGYYPYPDYEPMAFWGGIDRLMKIKNLSLKN
ncbi:NAD(P)-dependent oxidoreductase [Methanosarcina sp. 1.H.A.2.2]|uniref:NAD-dependent epimerase/dehydratase family protein n=1 Tax=Methanosarcina sp. 1.H.A.2.2 TaxID=1483601 RepID=UPI000621713C|nr:NAD(P)-dependent oxidoreductase [Methanosarcina sp. 1.H.A.2.2]KKH47428.1 epimerase [Methanosarcina sp. 1.H.A.2.2]